MTTSCDAIRACLSAWVDDETVPLSTGSMREHLAGCERCSALERELRSFRASLRQSFVLEKAPAPLERSIRGRAWVRRHGASLAIAAALAGVVAVAALTSSQPVTEDETVAAHEALATSRLPLDFTEHDAEKLSVLLRERLGFDLELPALARSNLSLRGARLAQLHGRDSALLLFDQ